ncbi:hypothetical protein CBF53_02000 [Lactobacillus taiwanensis]|uniref:Type I restriction modification DNA specificity domain-containing protein n=1 Tax=Lactobacillus taiwanensis TaxID=508451 RepID=A0ABX4ES90_9LACO|nr:restriction endonuclease subunit S [Lactobacillus taiwanensis]OYR88711.1 hypothetical protein CBF53_02000 [Lactobacillus taiwanensis]
MTKSDDKRVPVLRFKGFTDEWEQRKLGDLTQKIKSYPISHDAEINTITGTKYIHYGDIHTGKLKRITNEKILPNINDNNYIPLKSGDVIVADASEDYKGIADACVINLMKEHYKIVSGLHTIVFRPNEKLKSDFLYTYFHTPIFKHYGYRVGTGLKVFGITYNNLSNMEIKLPKIDEQNKVDKIINIVTNIITLQQRKLENYLLIKKKLSNIFFNDRIVNKNDLLFEHRVKANQLFISYSKKGFPHLPVLSASQDKGMVFRKDESKNILYTHDNLTNYKLVEPDDFVVHLRSFQGGFAYSDKTGIASPAYKIFKFKNNVAYNSVYWKEKFKSYNFIQLLKKITYGVRDGRSISFSDFLSLYLTFPDIKLQNKIGNVLSKLDTQISDQKEIIKKLENIKQFLLQNMFI